jgi:hypothetical protein
MPDPVSTDRRRAIPDIYISDIMNALYCSI